MATSELEENGSKMFGPLLFESGEAPTKVTCLVCEDVFNLPLGLPIFVKHLFEVHNLVIEEVQNVANLPQYLLYWRDKFKENSLEEIIPSVKIENSTQIYFLLSSLLKEDKDLRHRLRLEQVLQVQEFERTDQAYSRMCLFCKLNYEGTRAGYVGHLENQHNLQLGNPQNLVFIEELVEKINETLNNLICIYCNRVFPERNVLKEHMRKKLHKRLNWRNTEYDKFFIINYLESDRKGKRARNEDEALPAEDTSNDDAEYYDWNEKEDSINCLFCDKKETDINTLCLHMDADHEFDFSEVTQSFDFYQKVKFVNYVRRQAHNKRCFYCDEVFPNVGGLQSHLFERQHCKVPDVKIFDQPEFYFPTYENDAFLYLIDDVED